MKNILRRKPSASMVVAMTALCIAVSGTAIAASNLANGDKLIAKKSLSGNRLRNHTVSGKQVNRNKLGKVPSATNTDTVGGRKFVTSGGLIKITGAASPGHNQTVISSGPFTVTVTCTKTGSSVTESLDASSSEPNSDMNGTLKRAGASQNLDTRGPSSTFKDNTNTNIDLGAPSGAALDFMYSDGINSLGADCWIHFFGFR